MKMESAMFVIFASVFLTIAYSGGVPLQGKEPLDDDPVESENFKRNNCGNLLYCFDDSDCEVPGCNYGHCHYYACGQGGNYSPQFLRKRTLSKSKREKGPVAVESESEEEAAA